MAREAGRLSAREARFVEEYLVDLNGAAAARRAGYSARTAREQATDLLTRPHIAAAVAAAKVERSARTKVTQDAVVEELRRIAFSNLRDFLRAGKGGDLVVASLDDIPAECWPAVAEVRRTKDGEVRIKLHDKGKALERLYAHTGQVEEEARGDDFDAAIDLLDEREGDEDGEDGG